jgi:predicted PurR-regulated permease PerM
VANRTRTTTTLQPFWVFCGLLLVTAFLYWAQKVLIPVALAVLLAFILAPLVNVVQRRGLGRVPSVLVLVVFSFLLLGGVGWIISLQIGGLLRNLPQYRKVIDQKLQSLQFGGHDSVWSELKQTAHDISKHFGGPEDTEGAEGTPTERAARRAAEAVAGDKRAVVPGTAPENPLYVRPVSSGWSELAEAAGPAAEGLGTAFLVVVLVVFMLVQRENLRNRVVRLIGHGRLIVTTRAIDEGARRISRFLLMQLCVNAGFGVLLAVGMVILGVVTGHRDLSKYALLWGFICGTLRFVPYVGTWLGAALLFFFTVATLPDWGTPLILFAYFMVLELLTANVIEPLLFGHSTGVSPVALLLAAAFWTWLWGPVGLVLSTPLTVLLVVLGKYVPQLDFFEVLLGDEPALHPSITYYQRLVARDQDEAADLVEEFVQTHTLDAVYEQVLLPALVLARKDHDRGELDADDFEFVLRATREVLDDLGAVEQERFADKAEGQAPRKAALLACPARDEADEVALLVFARMLEPQGYKVEVISTRALAAEVLGRIGNECPVVVLVGSLPPGGLAQARYLCKRIKAQCPTVKIAVGRWGEKENLERIQKRLKASGADLVATTLADTRTQVVPLLQVAATAEPEPELAPAGGK